MKTDISTNKIKNKCKSKKLCKKHNGGNRSNFKQYPNTKKRNRTLSNNTKVMNDMTFKLKVLVYYFDMYNITSRLLESIDNTTNYPYIKHYISNIFSCIEPENFNEYTLKEALQSLIPKKNNEYYKINTITDNFFEEKKYISINKDYVYKQYCYLIKDTLLLNLDLLCENDTYCPDDLESYISYIEEVIYKFSKDDFKDIYNGTSTIIEKLKSSNKLNSKILSILDTIFRTDILPRLDEGISILIGYTLQLKDVIGGPNTSLFNLGESMCVFEKM